MAQYTYKESMGIFLRLSRYFAGLRLIGIAFTLFTLLNISFFILTCIWPKLLEILYLSADRPWGVITSAFVNDGFGHLVRNLEGFTFATSFFAVMCLVWPVKVRKHWSRLFLWLVFISGFMVNLIEYPLMVIGPSFTSTGASGIVYGALGVFLAACLFSLPVHLRVIINEHRRRVGKRRAQIKLDRKYLKILPSLLGVSFLISFLVLIFTDVRGFLGVAPGVDVFAHSVGFLFGLGSTIVWAYASGLEKIRLYTRIGSG